MSDELLRHVSGQLKLMGEKKFLERLVVHTKLIGNPFHKSFLFWKLIPFPTVSSTKSQICLDLEWKTKNEYIEGNNFDSGIDC